MKVKYIILFLVVATCIGSLFLPWPHHKITKRQSDPQQMLMASQQATYHAQQHQKLVLLLTQVLDKIYTEAATRDSLLDASILRLAAIGNAFYPYYTIEGDSISQRKRSPERGQLLQSLLQASIDSLSFYKIKTMISFEGADLRNANLYQADLRDVNLSGADLSGADTRGIQLANANLTDAILRQVDLAYTNMSSLVGTRADFRWADLTGANLSKSKLDGAQFQNTRLDSAIFTDAQMLLTAFSHASLRGANLLRANLYAAVFDRCNLENADLRSSKVVFTHMQSANLIGTKFAKAVFRTIYLDYALVGDINWLDSLSKWEVESCDYAQKTYHIQVQEGRYWIEKRKE